MDKNLKQLVSGLIAIGVERDFSSVFSGEIRTGKDRFVIKTNQQFNQDKVSFEFSFYKTPGKIYSMDSYSATFYLRVEIIHSIINGVDTNELEKQMKKADWYYDLAESDKEWIAGYKEINSIEDSLRLLSHHEAGSLIAVQLWNNHVPIESVEKPGFITRIEQSSGIYLAQSFPADTRLEDAYRAFDCCGQNKAISIVIANNTFLQSILSPLNECAMNEDNLEYLKNSLKFMGFEDRVNEELEKNIRAGKTEFTLADTKNFHNRKMDSVLHFRKGEQNERYFWNSYDTTMTRASDGSQESQRIFLNRGSGFTLKEAMNLLDRDENNKGRAVYKEYTDRQGSPYMGWKQIDFSRNDKNGNYEYNIYHEKYGFNLEKEVAKHPVVQLLNEEQKNALLRSLEKGNLQAVDFAENNNTMRRYLAADPENRRVRVFDEKLKEIKQEVQQVNVLGRKGDEQKRDVSNNIDKSVPASRSKSVEKTAGADKNESPEKIPHKTASKTDDGDSLLPKKRHSTGKGLGM